jgi:hypothetical protein
MRPERWAWFRKLVPLRAYGYECDDDDMRNVPVAEELATDHFHLALHLTVPFPGGDGVPVITATTSRHVNRHLVATGPLLALPWLDAPYPLPDMAMASYLQVVIDAMALLSFSDDSAVTWGTGGKRFKPNLMPVPVVDLDHLW